MRSLRLPLRLVSLKYRNTSYTSFKGSNIQSLDLSYSEEQLKQITTPSLLGMLEDHSLYPQSKHLIFKESYNRIPKLHQSQIIRMLRLFIESGVPTNVCVKLGLVLVMRGEALSQANQLEFLQIIFQSNELIFPFGNILKVILKSIDNDKISINFLADMWDKTINHYSQIQIYHLIWKLTEMTIKRSREFSNAQIHNLLKKIRYSKFTGSELIKAIHVDVISNRPKQFELMSKILSTLLARLKSYTEFNEKYSKELTNALKLGEVPVGALKLANYLAKHNYIVPGLHQDLEPYAVQHFEEGNLTDNVSFSYLIGNAISDYIPKKFIQAISDPDNLRQLMKALKERPFQSSGLEICTVINYANSKGIDLKLSKEVRNIVDEFTYLFSQESWRINQEVVNPWESRAKAALASVFPLYGNWPTCNGYIIDACVFFDKNGQPMSLSNNLDFLFHALKPFRGYFDKFGRDNVNAVASSISFPKIWNLIKSPDVFKGVHTKFAIELNGPYHFLKVDDSFLRIDGSTMLRRKFLQANGWEYIGIPFLMFEKIRNMSQFKLMIQNLIQHVLKFRNG